MSDVFPGPVSWLLGAVKLSFTTASSPSHQTIWQWSCERGASSYSGASAPVLHRFPWNTRRSAHSAKGISVFVCPMEYSAASSRPSMLSIPWALRPQMIIQRPEVIIPGREHLWDFEHLRATLSLHGGDSLGDSRQCARLCLLTGYGRLAWIRVGWLRDGILC